MLILGREEPVVAGIDSDIAEPAAAFVSEVEVMQHILADATDTMTRGNPHYYRAHDHAGGTHRHSA
jgi:hypothetical protein